MVASASLRSKEPGESDKTNKTNERTRCTLKNVKRKGQERNG